MRVTAFQHTLCNEFKGKIKEIHYFLGIDPEHKKEYKWEPLEGGESRCGVQKAGS